MSDIPSEIPPNILELIAKVDKAYENPGMVFLLRRIYYWVPVFALLVADILIVLYALFVKIAFTDLWALLAVALALASVVMQYTQNSDEKMRRYKEHSMSRIIAPEAKKNLLIVTALIRLRIFSEQCTLVELYKNDPMVFYRTSLIRNMALGGRTFFG
jgi:hypothetical protein